MKNIFTNILKGIFLLSFLFLIAISQQSKAYASELSIGTAPSSEKLTLSPGEKYNGELVVWNLADKTTTYNIIVRGFRQIENQPGTAILLTEDEEAKNLYTATKWLTISQTSIDLVPNKNEKIYYEINVPSDATKGEYTVMIAFISKDDSKLTGTGAVTALSSGMPVLIQIGNDFVENAELLKFSTPSNFYEEPNVTFETRISNLGDTHITPTGEIVLTNIFNQEVARIPFNTNTQSILRDNIGNYTTAWNLGSFITKDHALALGPIKAKLIVTYRTFQPGFAPLTSELSFWIIPWKYIIGLVVAIIALVVILATRKRKRKVIYTTQTKNHASL